MKSIIQAYFMKRGLSILLISYQYYCRQMRNHSLQPGVQIFVEHWGGYFAILPQFCPIFNIGEMNLDHHFFQVSKLSEEQKKRSSPKIEHFFPQIQVKTKKKVFTKNGTRRVARNSQWGWG